MHDQAPWERRVQGELDMRSVEEGRLGRFEVCRKDGVVLCRGGMVAVHIEIVMFRVRGASRLQVELLRLVDESDRIGGNCREQ